MLLFLLSLLSFAQPPTTHPLALHRYLDADLPQSDKAEEQRVRTFEHLKKTLSKGVGDEEKAEMMLQLAELYFQQGQALHLRAIDCVGCDPGTSSSQPWFQKSAALCEGLSRNFPRYVNSDRVTFLLGASLERLGQKNEAVEAFKQLVKLYPDSPLVVDGYLYIGEYYFDEGQPSGALKAYLKASTYPSEHNNYALYMSGWSYFQLAERARATETMRTLIDRIGTRPEMPSDQLLIDAARTALATFEMIP